MRGPRASITRPTSGQQEAEGKCTGYQAAVPFEFIDQRRHKQREGCAPGHADSHGHEGDTDDQPAIIERQSAGPMK
jgi:hypothetical protein